MYVLRLTFFSPPLIFTLVAASISHFLTAAIKFSCFSSNEIGLRCCFVVFYYYYYWLISRSSSFSVFHVNANINI